MSELNKILLKVYSAPNDEMEVKLFKWLKTGLVKKDDAIAEVELDKAMITLHSNVDGMLYQVVKEGEYLITNKTIIGEIHY